MTLALAVACDGAAGVASPTVTVSPVVLTPTATTPAVTSTPTPAETAVSTVAATLTTTPITTATRAPTEASTVASTEPARVLQLGRTDEKVVTLTFDAGADAGFTQEILDTLAANGVRGAFGVTGRWAEQNPELVKRIAAAGHEFINHTYDHSSFTGMSTSSAPQSQAARWEQLDRTEGIIAGLTGATTHPYFRPPYGDHDASVNRDVGLHGYRYNVMWTVDSRGWQGIPASQIVTRCLDGAEAGAIYIFHVGSASEDAAALQQVIDGLHHAGYRPVPLSDIIP